MSPLEQQIGWIGRLLAERVLTGEDAAIAASARASLEFLRKHEEGIREYIREVRSAKELPLVKEALREFPDADVIVRRV